MSAKRFLNTPGIAGFLGITAAGTAAVALVCLLAPISVQIACVGILVVVVLSLAAVRELRPGLPEQLHLLNTPLTLASDRDILELYQKIGDSLRKTSLNKDAIYRDLALERIKGLADELAKVAGGRIVFTCTETWRMAYEQLLRSPAVFLYRSVAHVVTSTYWQDPPGLQSMQVNFELIDAGSLNVERIAIFPDHLWPAGERFPVEPLCAWVDEQYNHGIWIKLARESALANEPGLLVDMGIYDGRAVGTQELDAHGRTVRFTLSFDMAEVLAAEQRWERLSVYSIAYQKLLDRATRSE